MSEFILILLAIIILFRVFGKWILFFAINAISKRLFNQFNNQQGFNQKTSQRPEGSVTIDTSKSKMKSSKNDDGDYVDYEEIK